jgi:uncharacterized protein (DUF433 family)
MAAIIDHHIAGTRITVWDVLHHVENNWSIEAVAEVFNLTTDQVHAALAYIQDHRDEVMKVHRSIEQRNARGNEQEVSTKLAEAHAKRLAWLKQRQEALTQDQERAGVKNPG